jgi:hypothetical protein
MPRNSKAAKKTYRSPSLVVLDANTAKAKLNAGGEQKDPVVQKMLSFAERQLNVGKAKPPEEHR